MTLRRFTVGCPLPGPSTDAIFEGQVLMREHVTTSETELLNVAEVTFMRGGRTRWHTHGSDQLLVVTDGHGIVAGEHAELDVRAGDAVLISAGERHWHGARSDTQMTHISILARTRESLYELIGSSA